MQTSVRGEDPGVVNRHHLIQKPHALQLARRQYSWNLPSDIAAERHPRQTLDANGGIIVWSPADALVAGWQAGKP